MFRTVMLACALAVGAPSLVLAQAQVTCKDGSTSKAGRGACSHHGGVAAGAAPAPSTPPPATRAPATPAPSAPTLPPRTPASPRTREPAAGQPTARCKDGSMSYSKHHSGTCSHHGGVAQWLQ
jgi:uncharacterized protein DUF3761